MATRAQDPAMQQLLVQLLNENDHEVQEAHESVVGQRLKAQATGAVDDDKESPLTMTVGSDGSKLAKTVADPMDLDDNTTLDPSGLGSFAAAELERGEDFRRSARARKSVVSSMMKRFESCYGEVPDCLQMKSRTRTQSMSVTMSTWRVKRKRMKTLTIFLLTPRGRISIARTPSSLNTSWIPMAIFD